MSDDLSKVDVLQAAVRRIIARCEAIEDENSTQLEREQTEASSGFLRGERHLAKSIRRELHDLTRNVAEPKGLTTNEPLPSDDIAKRMEALVRRMSNERDYPCQIVDWRNEARAIVALLPEPVDADREEAKKIALWHGLDSDAAIEAIEIGIAHGRTRALERDSREG